MGSDWDCPDCTDSWVKGDFVPRSIRIEYPGAFCHVMVRGKSPGADIPQRSRPKVVLQGAG